ncbi:MAG: hypothetical protein K9M57_01865 [Phycisphaerae bacterium]|nr:hypothetical protein [Phycisphaerae bacterium]
MATKKMAKKKTAKKSVSADMPTEIHFDYIKGGQFRVIHVDGAFGSAGPKLNSIQMALFSERRAIPKRETYEFDGQKLGALKKRESLESIVREIEVEAVFDMETAKALRAWLDEKIEQVETITKEMKT